MDELPRKDLYKTVWEIKQRRVLDMAADRGAYIDQSQSLRHGAAHGEGIWARRYISYPTCNDGYKPLEDKIYIYIIYRYTIQQMIIIIDQ